MSRRFAGSRLGRGGFVDLVVGLVNTSPIRRRGRFRRICDFRYWPRVGADCGGRFSPAVVEEPEIAQRYVDWQIGFQSAAVVGGEPREHVQIVVLRLCRPGSSNWSEPPSRLRCTWSGSSSASKSQRAIRAVRPSSAGSTTTIDRSPGASTLLPSASRCSIATLSVARDDD